LPQQFKRISIYRWHNFTAYIALTLAIVHPLLLLFDPSTKFHFVDLFYLVNAPTQKLIVALGTVAFFAFLFVIITTQKAVRKRLGFRTWKNIHLISYGTALLFIFNGLLIDPELKDRSVDLLDGEKLISVFCLLLLLSATIFRVRFSLKNNKKLNLG
jgi:sulfoxide reductase heme-binding subunit YedZ